MANISLVRGLTLRADLTGYQPQIRSYYLASGNGTATFVGDLVKFEGDSDTSGSSPTIAQCAAGNAAVGVVVGIDQIRGVTLANQNLYRLHRPANTALYAYVCDDPNALYEIECTTALTSADIGLNIDVSVGSGSTTTGMSGMVADASTKLTTAALVLKIMGLVQRPDNEFGANQKIIVKINNHQLGSHTGTAGV